MHLRRVLTMVFSMIISFSALPSAHAATVTLETFSNPLNLTFSGWASEGGFTATGAVTRPLFSTNFFDLHPISPNVNFLRLRTGTRGPGDFVQIAKIFSFHTTGTLAIFENLTRLESTGSLHVDGATAMLQRLNGVGNPIGTPLTLFNHTTNESNFVSWQTGELDVLPGIYRLALRLEHLTGVATPGKGASLLLQNLTFTPTSVVPIPGSIVALASAILALLVGGIQRTV